MAEDYCEMCDLPLSQCVHGMPKPPPAPEPSPPAPRASRATAVRASASRTPAASRGAKSAASKTTRTAPSLVTAQASFQPHIVRILKQEGPLETEDMLLELGMSMEDVLRERDRQTSPTGEVRWHTAARSERKAMITAGLMVEGKPGRWELTEAGQAVTG